MKLAIRWCALVVVVLSSGIAFADVPGNKNGGRREPREELNPPKEAKADEKRAGFVGIEIKVDKDATAAKLIIPDNLLAKINKTAADKHSSVDGNSRTMFAGVALSLALTSLVLLPRLKQSLRVTAAATVGFLTIAASFTLAQANVGPPPGYTERQDRSQAAWKKPVEIFVEKSENDFMTLILPESRVRELANQLPTDKPLNETERSTAKPLK